jgi:hypothetical protein
MHISICSKYVESCYPLVFCPTDHFSASATITYYERSSRHYDPVGSTDLDGVSNANPGDSLNLNNAALLNCVFRITHCNFYGLNGVTAVNINIGNCVVPSKIWDCQFAAVENTGHNGGCIALSCLCVTLERVCAVDCVAPLSTPTRDLYY